jgi:hypothetical protein
MSPEEMSMVVAILSSLMVGLVLGAGGMFASYRRYAEWEAWTSYSTGFRLGKIQGRRDAKASGVVWVEEKKQ